jgi:hypothetical protein
MITEIIVIYCIVSYILVTIFMGMLLSQIQPRDSETEKKEKIIIGNVMVWCVSPISVWFILGFFLMELNEEIK